MLTPLATTTADFSSVEHQDARYERLRTIGTGGSGVVYEVYDRLRKRCVALKTLSHSTPASLLSFKQEFRTLAELRHPNLVRMYELVSATEGAEFFTMELVLGRDFRHHTREVELARLSAPAPTLTQPALRAAPLQKRAQRSLAVSPARLEQLRAALPQLVAGLRALHGAGKLHRDIKPSNVMVSSDGRVVILDFGLSAGVWHQEPSDEFVAGTPDYMAPEQVLNRPLQPASDWYAVGVLLFDALTGRPPFQGDLETVMHQKLWGEAPRPSDLVSMVPGDLDELCVQLLARDPAARPSGRELSRLLGVERGASRRSSIVPVGLVGRGAELEVMMRALREAPQRGPTAILLHGPAGIGKSRLVSHFIEHVAREGLATALSARVYEQESIPYKAVDGIIDQLSLRLEDAQRRGDAPPADPSLWALGQLFPVLRRFPGFVLDGADGTADPLRVRELAFAGLRRLLSHLSRDTPLLVAIDDAQWGDLDSVSLLLDLLGKDRQLPLVLVIAHSERGGGDSAFLAALLRSWPSFVPLTDLVIGPLAEGEVGQLVAGALGGADEVSELVVGRVFQMSTGNAFLAQELAYALSPTEVVKAVPLVDPQDGVGGLPRLLLDERLRDLDRSALRLLEVAAASGRALAADLAGAAARVDPEEVDVAVSALSQRRLLRSTYRAGIEVLEIHHERIREWVLGRLSEAERRGHHRRLAETLEATPDTDADHWLEHWLRSGDGKEIRRVARAAAARAAERLALKQAESLYRTALAHVDEGDAAESVAICRELARVLEWDGRGAVAAEEYLRAAALSSGFTRAELESTAGLLLVYAGSFARGARLLRDSLAQLSLPAPTTRMGALASLVAGRVQLSRLEARLARVLSSGTSEMGRARVEVLHAAAFGFVFTDPLLGECMQVAHLSAALREGTAQQVARAVALEASQRTHRSQRGASSAERLFLRAEELARASRDPAYQEFVRACRGVSRFLCGDWRVAHDLLERAYCDVPRHTAGWHTTAWIYDLFALSNQGRFGCVAERLPKLLADADARGDRFTASTLRVSAKIPLQLAHDQATSARAELRECMAIWDQPAFLVQHWRAMWWGAEIELYEGRGGTARALCHRDRPRLQKSHLLRVQYIRGMTLFVTARAALATYDEDPKARARELRQLRQQLVSVGRPWTTALAAMVGAGLALRSGDPERSHRELVAAQDLLANVDMQAHAEVCRLALGKLTGGSEGERLRDQAQARLLELGVREPTRFAASLLSHDGW